MGIADFTVVGEDKLKRSYLLPKKVLWSGDGVTNSEWLLRTDVTQIYVGVPEVMSMSNVDGKKAAILLDFGSEFVGSLELLVSRNISNNNGLKLHMRFGESVSEAMTPVSEKNATNNHAVRDMTVLVTGLSQQTYAYTGYRFVYLELAEENAWIDFAAIRGVFTYRDIPYRGTFKCNDELLNQIYDVSAYTVHVNMQTMLWDGIKRDRLVWIGDMHPEMLVIRSVFGDQEIVGDCLRFITKTNPLPKWPNNITTYGLWYLLILWDWYWYNGEKDLVMELKDYWKGLLCQLLQLIHEEQPEYLIETELKEGFFVDWPTKRTEEAKAGVYALFRLALLSGAKLCQLSEDEKLGERCLECSNLLAKKDLQHNDKKQIVALLQLADMIDGKESGEVLINGGGRGMSTFMSYYILSAVANTVHVESALQMLREYYGAMLETGATTFWEDFDLEWMKEGSRIDQLLESGAYDIHGDNGRFCYKGMRHSLCHGWSAGPAAFLPERVLGIQILDAGCKKISIKPELGNLQWAKGTYPTPYGDIQVDVKREGNHIVTRVVAPDEIEVIQ